MEILSTISNNRDSDLTNMINKWDPRVTYLCIQQVHTEHKPKETS